MFADRNDDALRRRLEVADALQRVYADAALRGDGAAAELAIREAIEAGLDEATIDDRIIAPTMRLVGDLWADGELTVADEHLATEISLRVVALEREAFRVARERPGRRVLLAAMHGEQHVIGLSMAAAVLEHAGYDVLLLGADLPLDALIHAVARHEAAVVGVTVGTPWTAHHVPVAVRELRALRPQLGIVAGGRAALDAWESSADIAVCRHVSDAVAVVDGLAQRARSN
jgi:MerR family transcriptional regulator, light-induced transcriptional regulator